MIVFGERWSKLNYQDLFHGNIELPLPVVSVETILLVGVKAHPPIIQMCLAHPYGNSISQYIDGSIAFLFLNSTKEVQIFLF